MNGMANAVFRPFSWGHFPLQWYSVLQRCSNGPTMHLVLSGDTPDGSYSVFVFPPKSFVKLHSALQHTVDARRKLTFLDTICVWREDCLHSGVH